MLSAAVDQKNRGVMKYSDVAVVVLAAGKGTRMKSDKPKVLHAVNGQPMIQWVLEAAVQVADHVVVVVGHQADRVKGAVKAFSVSFALQKELLGTGDAVKSALPFIEESMSHVVILCGDVPLIRSKTIESLIKTHYKNKNDVTLLAVEVEDPFGYGRVILDRGQQVKAVREEADAAPDEKGVRLINSGLYCVSRPFLERAVPALDCDNAQKEFYLTDIIALACQWGCRAGVMKGGNPKEVAGINTLDQLLTAEVAMKAMDV